jgi:hypothetical protein
MGIPAPNTVSGLTRKHAEIAGLIEAKLREVDGLVADLDAVERTIRLFDPAAILPRPKAVASPMRAGRGGTQRAVIRALKAATGPLTSADIARFVIAARNLPDDASTHALIRRRVGVTLAKLKARGIVEEVPQAGDYKGWRLA